MAPNSRASLSEFSDDRTYQQGHPITASQATHFADDPKYLLDALVRKDNLGVFFFVLLANGAGFCDTLCEYTDVHCNKSPHLTLSVVSTGQYRSVVTTI